MAASRETGGSAAWTTMPVGTVLRVVKVAPDGRAVTEYPATVVDAGAPRPWIAVEATWTHRAYDLDGLLFLAGDTLHEFFSPAHWFNVFSVFAPDGTLRGWYANVTYPATLDAATEPPTLTWHDLYLDVVALPDGAVVIRDEDELAESGLSVSESTLYERILVAQDEILRRCRARTFPFHET
jgi:hypothetical protein